MTIKQLDTVILNQDSIHFRAGAQLVVLEIDAKRGVRVGISINDTGEWVKPEIVVKTA